MKTAFLPYYYKYIGIVLIIIAITLNILYAVLDLTLRLPVFAVYSSFLETKIFTSFITNVTDELIMLCYVFGSSMLVMSKEKIENEQLERIRLLSMFKAFKFNVFIQLFAIMFLYGNGFFMFLLVNLISFSVIYLVFFYLGKRKTQII